MSTTLNVLSRNTLIFHQLKRSLFYWINLQFNVIDENRRKSFGPDRICAEWILRNGGAVKWVNSNDILSDYNELPKEGILLHLQVIDASNSSIMHNGFAHFRGCNYITKVIFHKCNYLEDKAFEELHYLKKSLLFLQVSSCPNISEKGLMHLHILSKLKELIIFDLPSIKNKDVVHILKDSMPHCNIKYR